MQRDMYANQSRELAQDNATLASATPFQSISPRDKEYASKTFAAIKRGQYADYQRLYQPLHSEFIDLATNPDFALEQVDRVAGNVNASFDRANKAQQSTLARMGLEAPKQRDDIERSLAIAKGENSTRQAGEERQMSTLAGTLGALTVE